MNKIFPLETIRRAFSLVEVLAAVAIIGIVTFLAIPNIIQVKTDSEDNLARAKANTLNLAIASYIQAVGPTAAQSNWSSRSDAFRYTNCLMPYIAYADASLSNFTPGGYSFTLPTSIFPLTSKTVITNTSIPTNIDY
jgi:prepilin-type N-terminal cleavage/methylation domain-containing protein